MTRFERVVLLWVKQATTDDLVARYAARDRRQPTPVAAMEDRWLGLAILGELFGRGEIERITV